MKKNDIVSGGRMWRRPAWVLVIALAASLAGCGGEGMPNLGSSYPVKGKVTLADGNPVPKVSVVFKGPVTGSAITESDGTFAFKGDKAGLPAGDYKVRLEVVESKGSLKNQVLPFPKQYSDEDTSGLTASVKADGPNDFDFKLTKGDAAAKDSPGGARGPAKGH
jgi:Carboxypeptidase regulatory-like domain